MFAPMFSAFLPAALASHVFGRPVSTAARLEVCTPNSVTAVEFDAAQIDETPDLAQRVREVGEW